MYANIMGKELLEIFKDTNSNPIYNQISCKLSNKFSAHIDDSQLFMVMTSWDKEIRKGQKEGDWGQF